MSAARYWELETDRGVDSLAPILAATGGIKYHNIFIITHSVMAAQNLAYTTMAVIRRSKSYSITHS